MSAELTNVLDDEAGGAIAAFRELLTNETTDALDPVLITGSTVLVDDDLRPKLEAPRGNGFRPTNFRWTLSGTRPKTFTS